VAGVWRTSVITLRKALIRNPACVQTLKTGVNRMGITILSLQSMLLPLQNLVAWFAGAPARAHAAPTPQPSTNGPRRACCGPAPQRRPHARQGRALRVVRVLESNHASRGAGRMVISGRMADVCAELDRLAALEAAAG
jgi:hypothetical protein